MSEKQKQVTEQREQMRTRSQSAESRRNSTKGQIEKERKGVVELLLKKNLNLYLKKGGTIAL